MWEGRADRNNQFLFNLIELWGEGQPPCFWLLVFTVVSEMPAGSRSVSPKALMEKKWILIQRKCFQAGTHLCNHHHGTGAVEFKAGAAVFLLAASWITRMLRDKGHFGPVPSVLVSSVLFPDQFSTA